MEKDKIFEDAKTLRLAFLKDNYQTLIEDATNKCLSYKDFLIYVLEHEIDDRINKSIKKHLSGAGFPNMLTFENLNLDAFTLEIRNKIEMLKDLSFINNGQNIILCGNPGVGKTHISIALSVLACQKNMTVLFTSVPNLVIELREKASTNQLSSFKKKFCSYDLVVLDELGYIAFDKGASELLFNLLSTRNQNKSIIITTNLSFNRWNEVFGDEVLTAAMVDRLTHKAHVLNITGESYRIKETKEWLTNN